jgi:hypothetical protein
MDKSHILPYNPARQFYCYTSVPIVAALFPRKTNIINQLETRKREIAHFHWLKLGKEESFYLIG